MDSMDLYRLNLAIRLELVLELEKEHYNVKDLRQHVKQHTLSLHEIRECERMVQEKADKVRADIKDAEKIIDDCDGHIDSEKLKILMPLIKFKEEIKEDLSWYDALAERLKNAQEKMCMETFVQLTDGEEGGGNEKIK